MKENEKGQTVPGSQGSQQNQSGSTPNKSQNTSDKPASMATQDGQDRDADKRNTAQQYDGKARPGEENRQSGNQEKSNWEKGANSPPASGKNVVEQPGQDNEHDYKTPKADGQRPQSENSGRPGQEGSRPAQGADDEGMEGTESEDTDRSTRRESGKEESGNPDRGQSGREPSNQAGKPQQDTQREPGKTTTDNSGRKA